MMCTFLSCSQADQTRLQVLKAEQKLGNDTSTLQRMCTRVDYCMSRAVDDLYKS